MDQRAVTERLREELLRSPDPAVVQRHLALMRAAAERGGAHTANAMRKRLGSLALAAALVLGAGIAAGLTLPEQANHHAKDRTADLVVEGPGNQGENGEGTSQAASAHGAAVSEVARDRSTEGCEHGRAVSELASSGASDHRKNQGSGPECEKTEQNGPQGNEAAASAAGGSNGHHGPGAGQSAEHHGNRGRSEGPHGSGAESQRDPGHHGGPPDTAGPPTGLPTPNEK